MVDSNATYYDDVVLFDKTEHSQRPQYITATITDRPSLRVFTSTHGPTFSPTVL